MKTVNLLMMVISDIVREVKNLEHEYNEEKHSLGRFIEDGVCDEFDQEAVDKWKKEKEICKAQEDVAALICKKLYKRLEGLDK